MSPTSKRRRWVGIVCLAIAIVMVVAGEFLLPGRFSPYAQLTYWFICFIFVGAAMLVAVVDMLMMRQESRNEQRALLERTIREIQEEKAAEGKSKD
jgi:hypothetical protein